MSICGFAGELAVKISIVIETLIQYISMDFCIQLSAYYPSHKLGGKQLYSNMLEQAVLADPFGTGEDEALTKLVNTHFDLTPGGIIERLRLRQPIYRNTAAYGHFGREEPGFTWEKTDYAERLQ